VRFTNRIWTWLDQVDRGFIREHLEKHEFLPILKVLEGALFQNVAAKPAGQ
jgi:hypothetical protein